ncbi:OLC1v1012852C1 [Oldenlandia corymbosa var. corymbosa]|uniref:OLC1v1012852C1 n=1 Tax=Oldenlandia corymbosa var. corymbosa TaxID=529605 RepID=A0AAV1DWV0_OLDCO|nr:OLC1v1012852C1 [Oldenlandia corymbosa var. corymbosa]
MSSSKNTVGLFGDAKIFYIKNLDDEGSSNKVSKKRKLRRLVKASEAGTKSKKKKKQTPAVEKEGPTEEANPIEEDKSVEENRHIKEGAPIEGDKTIRSSVPPEKSGNPETGRDPSWFATVPPSLSQRRDAAENPDASPGSSSYTAAAAIFHFGDDRIECPIIEEVAETMTDEEALKILTTSFASILMRKKKLREEISSLELEKGFLEREKAIYDEASDNARNKEQLIRAAKEEELATAQAMYRDLEAKLKEYGETHIPKAELQEWMTAFWARMMPTGGMANVMVGISEAAIALGGHGMAVAALERMESGKPVNAGWLQQFVKPHPRKTLREAMQNGLLLPPAEPGEEMRVLELDRDFIGVELVSDEDSSERVEEEEEEDQEPEVEKDPTGENEVPSTQNPVEETSESQPNVPPNPNTEPYYVHNVHLMILDEDEIKHFPMYAMISSALRKFGNVHNTTIVRALEKEIVDAVQAYNGSLILEANISDEMKMLKDKNARLRKREKIMKRTKEAEFYSKQVFVLQNLLVDNEIALPIFDDLDPNEEVKERTAAEEYLLRIDEQDWEIVDLKDKLGHCINQLRAIGFSRVIKPSRVNPRGKNLKI